MTLCQQQGLVLSLSRLSPLYPFVSQRGDRGTPLKTEKLGNSTDSFQAILALGTGWGTCDLLVGHQQSPTAQPGFPWPSWSLIQESKGAEGWAAGHKDPGGVDKLPQIFLFYFRQSNEQMVKSSNSSSTSGNNTPLSPVKTTFSGQTCVSSIKPGPLPSNLDDLKVSANFVTAGAECHSLSVLCCL